MVMVTSMLVVIVTLLFLVISYKKLLDSETFSSYECGFNNISGSRLFFSFRFFLISILFLIFDVEIALMLPIPYLNFSWTNIYPIYLFILVLIGGLVYEFFYGSLNWLTFISKA
uniref:NADH dehydrogenase subunit 3 n=1 Tax=Araniella displicata TaxID=336630 RepID=UPI00207AD2A0|nr:NADH dehydrogenase subunit 3 [Araniella displicata]URW97646.1 NADH dehydrogenase subunit 3 [Araniella displicata]